MDNFTFRCATKIIFGKGAETQTGSETVHYSRNILLHYGGNSIRKSGLYDSIVHSLTEAGVCYHELGGVVPNPRLSLVREGIRLCREHKIDFILAVGGGSVIDSAKSISAGVPYDGDVWDFYTAKASVQSLLPVGAVLTIPAAGSEASDSNVITNDESTPWVKTGFGHTDMRPVFTIMNPELTFTLPAFQTACGCMDIMAHVMERYFTNVQQVDLTDRLCEAVLKTIIRNVSIALAEPGNYASRAEIMWAGTIAQNDLVGTGRQGDWANHVIEHVVSGMYDIAHGAGLAVTFPAWMKHVYRHDVSRFAQFAVRVWDVDMQFDDAERVAVEGIRRFESFVNSIGLATSFHANGIASDRFTEMADSVTLHGAHTVGSFVRLSKDDVLKIFLLAE